MKIVTCDVSGGADDETTRAAVHKAVSLAKDADRLLLFGQAAHVGAKLALEEKEQNEGAWLDDAAAWLLREDAPSAPPSAPPARPAPGPLTKAVAVVSARADLPALPRSDRVVEMVGTLLVMAVPHNDDVDTIDNAHLWLVGGAPFHIAPHNTRSVVSVGDRVVVATVFGGEATLQVHTFDGAVVDHALALTVSTKMSVRSA